MKLFFVKGRSGWDDIAPILVLADTKEEAEEFAKYALKSYEWNAEAGCVYKSNAPNETGKAGEGYELKKGVIWKQFNAG